MNRYELTIVLDGKTTPAKKKSVIADVTKLVETFKGKVVSQDDWGEKDLAYKIKKSATGHFITFNLELDGEGARLTDGKLRVDENIIRYLFISVKSEKQTAPEVVEEAEAKEEVVEAKPKSEKKVAKAKPKKVTKKS